MQLFRARPGNCLRARFRPFKNLSHIPILPPPHFTLKPNEVHSHIIHSQFTRSWARNGHFTKLLRRRNQKRARFLKRSYRGSAKLIIRLIFGEKFDDGRALFAPRVKSR